MDQRLEKLQQTYQQLVNAVSWSVDKQILLIVASYYASTGKEFNATRYLNAIDMIKKEAKWYSPLRGHLMYSMAAFVEGEADLRAAIHELITNEAILKEAKFKRSEYSYLASLFLTNELSEKTAHANRARVLYEAIRGQHPFLTSFEDIPFVVLLSKKEEDMQVKAETMNRYYKELRTYQFQTGNYLQWLSQLLTLHNSQYDNSLVPAIVNIRDELKNNGLKIKAEHYPLLGVLALMRATKENVMNILSRYNELKNIKLFKWYRNMALSVAIQFETHQFIEVNDSLTVSLLASLEMMLQAQQAVMIAACTAAVAASNNNASD